MKLLRLLIIALISLGGWKQTSLLGQEEQSRTSSAAPYSGTEYFISFPRSDPDRRHHFMGLMITSEVATICTIEVPIVPDDPLETIKSFETTSFEVEPRKVTMIPIDRSLEPDYPGEANHNGEASERTVRLTSRAPVSVTVINARQGSSGAYSVLPVDHWGKEYMATILPATPNHNEITNQVLITAASDETEITVSPSAKVSKWDPGEKIRFQLNRNQTWLLQANALPGTNGSLDLSGTTITASKPVGVVVAHTRAALSENPTELFDSKRYAAWHAIMQMPMQAEEWGIEYFATPLGNTNDRFRVIAKQSTSVHVDLYDNNGGSIDRRSIELRPGQVVDVTASSIGMQLNGPTGWSSNKQFMLTQIKTSGGDYPNPENSPELIRLVPTNRYANRTVFGLPNTIGETSLSEFDLRLIATGNGNPFENILVDGLKVVDLPNGSISRITGNYWSFKGTIVPGGHTITTSNGVLFTGNVKGNSGDAGSVSLGWGLPHWSATIEADVTPPRILAQTEPSTDQLQVVVTDRTQTYFSGIDEVAVYNSPGWERNTFNRPFDPDLDATAQFNVKAGVDPSGPLTLLLRDRDGNEATTQVHNGVCQKTAYAATDNVTLFVGNSGQDEKIIRIDANPCGDEAHITRMKYDLNTEANKHLEAPAFTDGGSTPYTIGANDSTEIRIRTHPNLSGEFTVQTTLELIIDDQPHKIPITLVVDRTVGIADENGVEGFLAMQVAPNPFTQKTFITFGKISDKNRRVEIIDALGSIVRTYQPSELAGNARIEWNGKDKNGKKLGAGLYIARLTSSEGTSLRRILLVR